MKQVRLISQIEFRFLFISMLLVASSSSADPALDSCRRGLGFLTEKAHGKQEISIVRSDRVAPDDAGALQPTIELRWMAFAEEFVVNLKNPPKPEKEPSAEANPLGRELFAGDWQGHKAELVVFWRWPSGAWEGDLKQGLKLYSIRVPCEQRAAGASEIKPSIFLIDYPAEPEA